MSTLFVVGVAVWMIGEGIAKLPNTGYIGGVTQIVGGILALVSVIV